MINTEVNTYIASLFDSLKVSVPKEELDEFISLFQVREYKKGEHLVNFEDKQSIFGFITKGLIRFYFNTFEGKELNQTFKKEKEIFMNYYPHFSGEGSPFAIEALEDTQVYYVLYDKVLPFYDKARGWDRLGRKLTEQNFMIKAERERELLTFDSMNRYESFLRKFPDLSERLSKHHIALYLRINPASLSRLIKARS